MAMTQLAERKMLLRHGTKAFTLKPNSIVQAARQDLLIKERKSRGDEEMARPYAFCRSHVKKAATPAELIEAALSDINRGLASNKYNTLLIYSDEDVLRAAHECALAEEDN